MKIIECPRDAMQGLSYFVNTELKIQYLNQLLKVGFDTLDFGSFVSPYKIPQMQDTSKVVQNLDLTESDTKLLAIIANLRGARQALEFEQIACLGYPFSISETFQIRNTNTKQEEAFKVVAEIFAQCQKKQRELVIYLSMGFGNPYGDVWHEAIVEHWVDRFEEMGIKTMSLSDTVGVARPAQIANLFASLSADFPEIEFGAHLHTEAKDWQEKIEVAYRNGCTRFDGAIKGYGGCPLAQNSLVGNMPTELLGSFFEHERADFYLNLDGFGKAILLADTVFKSPN